MFNKQDRTMNVLKSSFSGAICNLGSILIQFGYRTVFLMFLGKEYIGINGLFNNILQIFSLMDLGIATIISYRLYRPIRSEDLDEVAAYLNLYKKVYNSIGVVVCVLGTTFLSIIHMIVDLNEVPADVNAYIVFELFVIQSAASYFCTYKQILITADQKGYIASLFTLFSNSLISIIKIVVLISSSNYTLVVLGGIFVQIILHISYSRYISRKYKDVFAKTNKLPRKETFELFKETLAGLCHKIGGVVVTSTDSILISKFFSLSMVGIYSNYSFIISSVVNLFSSIFSNVTSSIGSFNVNVSEDKNEELYLHLQFFNLFMSWISTICIYILINPFINNWQGQDYLLTKQVVAALCIQFFLQSSNCANGCFINATGLYVRDKIRPLIEAILNIVISIILVHYLCITGVFLGTVISGGLTYYWRQYYLLYRFVFKRFPKKILLLNIKMLIISFIDIYILSMIFHATSFGWISFFREAFACFFISIILFVLFFIKNEHLCFFVKRIKVSLKRYV